MLAEAWHNRPDWHRPTFDYSFIVRKFVREEGWVDLGEFATREDAETFYDECYTLDRFEGALVATIIRRSVSKYDSDFIFDEEIERRGFYA